MFWSSFTAQFFSENIDNIGVGVNDVNVLNPVTSQITMLDSPQLHSSSVNCVRFDCQEEGLLKPKFFFTANLPFIISTTSYNTYMVDCEPLFSTTVVKKCDVETGCGRQEH